MWLYWINLFVTVWTIDGHISLTFPQARYPPLDFLDSYRTEAPCGVPKPHPTFYTKLIAGDTYNITWRMAYAHQGGFDIVLLDKFGRLKQDLTPSDVAFIGTNDQTLQWHQVNIREACKECVIQMRRQALEWGTSYIFHSCADVMIETKEQLTDAAKAKIQCTDHGIMNQGNCQCDTNRPYIGSRCQYEVECKSDIDCNGGRCVDTPDNIPAKVCYCPWGIFGPNCDKSHQPSLSDQCFNFGYNKNSAPDNSFSKYNLFNPSCYEMKDNLLGGDDYIYWREIGDEIEFVLDFVTDSWLAVGWRPLNQDVSCKKFPTNKPSPYATAEPEPEPESGKTEPEPSAESEPKSEPNSRPEPNGEPEPSAEGKEKKLHSMDCMDVVVGAISGDFSRVADHYTRDRSTPLLDKYYHGKESLTAAYGVKIGQRNVIMFRKPIVAPKTELADNSLGPGRMYVIFAKGQQPGNYHHNPPSGLESGGASRKENFYIPGQLKYHGDQNRGIRAIEFTKKGANRNNNKASIISINLIFVIIVMPLSHIINLYY